MEKALSRAGLVAPGRLVSVGPPLFWRGPSWGSCPVMLEPAGSRVSTVPVVFSISENPASTCPSASGATVAVCCRRSSVLSMLMIHRHRHRSTPPPEPTVALLLVDRRVDDVAVVDETEPTGVVARGRIAAHGGAVDATEAVVPRTRRPRRPPPCLPPIVESMTTVLAPFMKAALSLEAASVTRAGRPGCSPTRDESQGSQLARRWFTHPTAVSGHGAVAIVSAGDVHGLAGRVRI